MQVDSPGYDSSGEIARDGVTPDWNPGWHDVPATGPRMASSRWRCGRPPIRLRSPCNHPGL